VRTAGVSTRDVYGIRVADSARGYKSLGKAGDITRAQHCRAEFYAQGICWIPGGPG
jgi:transglutaminase-like putative cysteine protease